METKIKVDKGKLLARKWGFSNCEGIDCKGLSGGLLIMWENYIKVNVSLMKKNLICAYIINHENQFWISCVDALNYI